MNTSEIKDFEAIRIILASAEDIYSWSYGEVTKPETINYRTFRPEKDGLFDEKIFGPTKDWECYCGKYKRIRYRGVICDKCGVEITQSKVRRDRMGHIGLASPIAHVWFFRGSPSKLSQLLDITPRNLESIIYFAQYLVISVNEEKRKDAIKRVEEKIKKEKVDISLEFKKKEKESEKETNKEIKKLAIKKKEQKELIVEEMKLKGKAKQAVIKDQQAKEVQIIEDEGKVLLDRIKSLSERSLLTEDEYLGFIDYGIESFIKVGMGAEALLDVLKKVDLSKLGKELREEVQNSSGQKQIKATKTLKIVEGLRKAGIGLDRMVLKYIPVIPPDLRPMVQLSGGRFATSDLNDLYRRVINRNNRLKRLTDLGAPEIILRNEKRMLQEAVDALLDSSQKPTTRANATQQLRSLSDMLKGKQGRFRQNLLGKRVDYSGRSVIIVAPDIKLNECRVPKEMALELFKPYVLRELIFRGYSPNVKSAKNILERRGEEVWDILEDVTKNHPVLLNRAPTLHRLGFQAFYPVLTEGSAIGIHPSVCAGYGADFDGDQMAIHIPLSRASQEEAVEKMMTTNNLLRPADGEPIMTPSRDVFLGIYYLTKLEVGEAKSVFSSDEAVTAYQANKLGLRTPIKILYKRELITTSVGRIFLNNSLPKEFRFVNKKVTGSDLKEFLTQCKDLFGIDRTVELIDAFKDLGFEFATVSGISMSIYDSEIIEEKGAIIKVADAKVDEIENNFQKGLITEGEKTRLAEEVWADVTTDIDEKTWVGLSENNPLRIMQESGARGSRDQIKQLAGMRGLVADPMGKIVELPSKSNYREGLDIYEYFTSTRGARKGLVDKALKTADAGYLTRRLVDVAHDVIVRQEDCKTKAGIFITDDIGDTPKFSKRLYGRVLAEDLRDDKKKIVLKKGSLIEEGDFEKVKKAKISQAKIRSTLTCESKYGICIKCYGVDLSVKKIVAMGTPVGVIAAQSIGEPGTQLTMRTFHLGGIIGLDITQGLPRVDEIFEARLPKTSAVLAEVAGKVKIIKSDDGIKVQLVSKDKSVKSEKEYTIPISVELLVKEGQEVEAGDKLTAGHIDLKLLLETKGLRAVQQYAISELQRVYESQGAPINDKHFEVIVRKMGEKVKIKSPGDTSLLPGDLVDKRKFSDENAKVLAEGGEPSTASVVILGITRASLYTESVLSAASFQETTSVLRDAAISGKVDYLRGLKENVIIGRLIPTGDRARIDRVKESRDVEKSVVEAEKISLKEVAVGKTKSPKQQSTVV